MPIFDIPGIFSILQGVITKSRIGKSNWIRLTLSISILALAIIITQVSVNRFNIALSGYLGIFGATFLGSSTILFPAPNIPIMVVGCFLYNPFWVAIIGGLGWGAGEFTGYLLGKIVIDKFVRGDYRPNKFTRWLLGKKRIEDILDNKKFKKTRQNVENYGGWAVFAFSLIPNPVFDFVGIAAGASGMSMTKFLIPCILGRIVSSLLIAGIVFFLFLS